MGVERWLYTVPLRLRSLVRRDHVEQELNDELQFHVEKLTQEHIARGQPLDEARRAALRATYGMEALKDECRDTRRVAIFENLARDIRYAFRVLGRSPTFTAVAVISIAIGIGANTAIFTVVNALLLRPAPGVADPDRVVGIFTTFKGNGFGTVSVPNYLDIRDRATLLAGIYLDGGAQPMSLLGTDGAEPIFGATVSGNYFTVLGIRPFLGRTLEPTDDQTRAGRVVVISHQLWQRRFNANPLVVGQTITLNGQPFTIVGVAADGFHGPRVYTSDLWVPIGSAVDANLLTQRDASSMLMGGRLNPGVSIRTAQAELSSIALALEREYPDANRGKGLRVEQLSSVTGTFGLVAAFMALLMAIVGLVLLVACANLAGVLLAQGTERSHEIAVRLALGAGRGRVIGQLLTETVLLFLGGGIVGLALALVATRLVVALLPSLPVPVELSLALDGRVVAFTSFLSLVAALACGLAPAVQTSKVDVVPALKDDTQGRFRRSRLRSGFLVGQIALSLVLVVTAGLLVRALQHASSVGVGFDSQGVELSSFNLSQAGYSEVTGRAFLTDVAARVRQIPGVQAASVASTLSLGSVETLRHGALSLPDAGPEGHMFFNWILVEPGYFATMRLPLVRGRDFDDGDRASSPNTLILSETAARLLFPGQDPVDKRLTLYTGPRGRDVSTLIVVGVARDGQYRTIEGPLPFVYAPLQQQYFPGVTIVTRTEGERRVAPDIRRLLATMNPNLPVLKAQTMDDAMAITQVPQRVAASIAGGLGIVSLFLAAIGIYGVAAHSVSRRTREIGIRVAIGARPHDVLALVFRQGLILTGIGVISGLALSAAAARLLANLLLGISPFDPVTFAGVALLFGIVSVAASYAPARRALRIDPTTALRYD